MPATSLPVTQDEQESEDAGKLGLAFRDAVVAFGSVHAKGVQDGRALAHVTPRARHPRPAPPWAAVGGSSGDMDHERDGAPAKLHPEPRLVGRQGRSIFADACECIPQSQQICYAAINIADPLVE